MLPELVVGEEQNKGVVPEFYMGAIENKAKSLKEGRPIFDDVEMVKIFTIGDKLNIPEHKVTDIDRGKWPAHYRAFKDKTELATEGTPLEEWPSLTRSRVMEFKALKIRTVEQLADLPEASIRALGMGGRGIIEKAKAFIESAKGSAGAEALAKVNAELKQDLEMLREQIKDIKDGDLAVTVAALKKELIKAKKAKKTRKKRKKK